MTEHFTFGPCDGSDYQVQILEKLDGNGRTDRSSIDPLITTEIKSKEKDWMLRLRSVYPYGLNDRIGDDFKHTQSQSRVGSLFPPLPRLHQRVSRGKFHKRVSILLPDKFISNLNDYLINDLPATMNFIRVSLSSMKKTNLKDVYGKISTLLSEATQNTGFNQWYHAILDIIETNIYTDPPVKRKKPPPNNVCKVLFHNKGVELINLLSILQDKALLDLLPSSPCKFDVPMVTYKLQKPIFSKIFNYNKFVREIDVGTFLLDDSVLP